MHLRIHICPVSYEVDRVALPLVEMKADRAILVTKRTPRKRDKARSVIERITKRLDGAGIEWELLECDIDDFHDCLRAVGSVIRRETEAGNHVLVNITSGGRILSHASTVAGMMWGAGLYYAHAKKDLRVEREPTRGVREIVPIPPFRIEPPPDSALACLRILGSHGGTIAKKELIARLQNDGLLSPGSDSRQTLYSSLGRFLRPLVQRGWVIEEGRTRSRTVQITEQGRLLLRGFDGSHDETGEG